MNKWNLVFDVDLCCNCGNCAMAVKDEYVGNAHPGTSAPQPAQGHEWIRVERFVRGQQPMVDVSYVPSTCNHCDDAPCVKAGDGAVTKRPDGIVVIDPQRARHARHVVASCPYGAIWWNEEEQVPQLWPFDAHLLDRGWTQPRLTQVCPTGAAQALHVSDEAMAQIVTERQLQVLRPELQTRPRVYYRNLRRVQSVFVGGNVAAQLHDATLCNVEGARVALEGRGLPGGLVTATDEFGDFRFDGLPAGGGEVRVAIAHPDFGSAECVTTLESSRYLGSLTLR